MEFLKVYISEGDFSTSIALCEIKIIQLEIFTQNFIIQYKQSQSIIAF
jgi:hypothetical protein